MHTFEAPYDATKNTFCTVEVGVHGATAEGTKPPKVKFGTMKTGGDPRHLSFCSWYDPEVTKVERYWHGSKPHSGENWSCVTGDSTIRRGTDGSFGPWLNEHNSRTSTNGKNLELMEKTKEAGIGGLPKMSN